MKEKIGHVLIVILIIGCLLCTSTLGRFLTSSSFHSLSSFELQEKYAVQLEKKLINLLEPATGIGNVRASVQASIIQQNISKKKYNPFTMTEEKIHKRGPILENQSVSVLINEKDKHKISAYKNLIEAAIGYDSERGDRLSVEFLPFAQIPWWTLGLRPIILGRIAFGLMVTILLGLFFLIKEGRKKTSLTHPILIPNNMLWEKAENMPSKSLAYSLQKKNPEIIATILNQLSVEKASELMENFSEDLKKQISLHLDHIEKLGIQAYLLQTAERCIYQVLKNISDTGLPFNQFSNWSDEEIQNLLHYVHKTDFIKALQTTPLHMRQIFERNIPPSLWREFVQKGRLNPCTEKESLEAQEKIVHLAKLLKKGN